MLRVFEIILLGILIAVDLVISKWIGLQAYSWMPQQATTEAKQVDNLFSFLVAVGAFIFIGIVGVILYSILTCRAPRGDWSHGHPARSDWRIEALWTIVPLVFVLWIAAQSYSIYQQLNIQGLTPIVHHLPLETPAYAETKPTEPNQTKPTAEAIEVIAKQWVWLFRYPADGNRGSVTSTELHLPVNQSVTMKLQSEDVLHGFYVPEFRVKQDIIPNRAITFVFTPIREGKYRLQDSQLSGAYFALMGADVYVESPEAYRQWLTSVANRPAAPAQNPAFSEYSQRPKGWPTVRPAQPLVNSQPLPL